MTGRTRVVGVAGGSAAGKTSLTHALKNFWNAQAPSFRVEVVSVDAFFLADKTQGPRFISPSRGETLFNFNHPDAIEIARLLEHLDSRTHAEDAPQVLLVEGLMTLHIPEIRNRLDLRLFVELEADVRALRRLLRDMRGGRASTDPEFIATYYLESARVGHEQFVEPSRVYADFIVRGDADLSRLVPRLAAVTLQD